MDPWGRPYGGIPFAGHPCLLASGPKDYMYMRVLRFFLRVVGGWPMKELNEKQLIFEGMYYGSYINTLGIIYLLAQLSYFIENCKILSFFVLGQMFVSLLLNIVGLSRSALLILSKNWKLLAFRFLTEAHVFYHKDKSDYSRKIYHEVHRICKWFTIYQVVSFALAWFLFNLMPLYLNYVNGKFYSLDGPVNTTYELSVFIKLPIDPERDFSSYCWVFLLNCYTSFVCADGIIFFDTLLSLIVFNLWGHFKILLHNLVTFPRPVAMNGNSNVYLQRQATFSPEEQEMVAQKLRDNIGYHRYILSFTKEMSECFGLVLFIYYIFHQVSGCVLLLECSLGPEAFARYLPLTVLMTFQLIQISIIFETIKSMSEQLRDEVYCLPWEHMNKKNKKTVLIFLINIQKPVHVKAAGLVNVGVTTMAKILKTSLSFYAFLRTLSDKNF